MDEQTVYEKWRRDRSQATPAADFADRVMRRIEAAPAVVPGARRGWPALGRVGLCAAAAVAILVRVVELLSLLLTTGIDAR